MIEAPGGEPGHPHTGWVFPYHTDELEQYKRDEVLEAASLLISRVTYEGFSEAWPERDGEPILVAGSGTLVHSLVQHGLVDELRMMVFPVVVADGLRLFPDVGEKLALELAGTKVFRSGVVVHAFRSA